MANLHSSTALFDGEHWMPRTSPMPTIVAGVAQQPGSDFSALFNGAMTLAPRYMDKTPGLDHPRAMSFREHRAPNLAFAEQEQQIAASMLGTAEMEMVRCDVWCTAHRARKRTKRRTSARWPSKPRRLTRSGLSGYVSSLAGANSMSRLRCDVQSSSSTSVGFVATDLATTHLQLLRCQTAARGRLLS